MESGLELPKEIEHVACPVEQTVVLMGNKWSLLIVKSINEKKILGFNQLMTILIGISSKTLSSKLKDLVSYGVVNKELLAGPPIRVEYTLTKKGLEFTKILKDMAKWSLKWHQ